MTAAQETMPVPVSIIGAGIGGLTLGRALLKRGIPAILYDKAPSKPRHAYAITLHSSTYKSLLSILDLDETTFKSRLAVDAITNGTGVVRKDAVVHWGKADEGSMRVNRSKFEVLLREGLDIRWESGVDKIDVNGSDVEMVLQSGQKIDSKLVVAADGVHSTVRRTLLPSIEAKVLPFVAFNGKRRIPGSKFDELFAPNMDKTNVLEYKHDDGAVMNISISDVESERISITWTYSRPERGSSDALYKPNRPQAGATEIPPEFFAEIGELSAKLPQPFKEVFNVETLKNERILHWLMRSLPVPTEGQLNELAEEGVVFIGDSVHAEPILGGEGANEVIVDAMDLANVLSESDLSNRTGGVKEWYRRNYDRWRDGVARSEKHIAEMH